MDDKKATPALICILAVAILLTGCGTAPRYRISVDSINDPARSLGKTYVLLSGDPKVSADDLQFKEFAGYVRQVLASVGYTETDRETAEIAIFMRYGIGEPSRIDYSSSTPIFGVTGGGTSSFTTFSSSGRTTMGTISSPTQFGVVGERHKTRTVYLYPRWLVMEAADFAATRDSKKLVMDWRTTVTSSGTSADLRRVFPYLIVGAKDYIGGNTGQMVDLIIWQGDDRIRALTEGK